MPDCLAWQPGMSVLLLARGARPAAVTDSGLKARGEAKRAGTGLEGDNGAACLGWRHRALG